MCASLCVTLPWGEKWMGLASMSLGNWCGWVCCGSVCWESAVSKCSRSVCRTMDGVDSMRTRKFVKYVSWIVR